MSEQHRNKNRSDEHQSLPKVEDTEFSEEKSVGKVIQRAYNQSGKIEPLDEEEED